jgi:hypothetical protein
MTRKGRGVLLLKHLFLGPSWAMASIFALSFPMSPNNASGHFGVSLGKNEVFNTLYTIDGDKE